ncbi:MAG: aminoacetone oxidase family FAD-binding enzyme [Gemmatimonadota bacterium]|nr:aminoacetone oxidase family FAD-binding enzyme [Gemmatimonadota bacterium]
MGAGAAGLMAAISAATAGAETELLERTPDGGRKILISGGGRCNILPARLDESRFVTDSSPNTLKKIVRSWPLAEQIAFFQRELGLSLVEETETGKLFPSSNRARDVRDGLLALAARCGVRFRPQAAVVDASPSPGGWKIELESGAPLEADALIVATGGLSVPKTGSDGLGLRLAERLGHTVHPTYPALTPLTATPAPFGHLAGVSLEVTITARGDGRSATATGGFLFTHRGYSGPAVLDVSHVVTRAVPETPAEVRVCWTELNERAWEAVLQAAGPRTALGALRGRLPERLALALLEVANVTPARPLAQLRRDERRRLTETLVRCPLPCTGHEGYHKAEVTGGGVSLAEIDPRTMESKQHRGLFLCGELLDAFGPIGGYNFLWAWVTGRAAGQAVGGLGG